MLSWFLFLWLAGGINSSNILVWSPAYGQSHVNFMANIAGTLSTEHNVTLLIVEYDRDITLPTRKQFQLQHYIPKLVDPDEWSNLLFKKSNVFFQKTFELKDYWAIENINYRVCQSMLEDLDFIENLRLPGFDQIFLEMFHFCPIGIAELTDIPKIVLASNLGMTMTHYTLTSLDINLSKTPVFMSAYGTNMKFTERMFNVLSYFVQKMFFLRTCYSEQYLFSKYFDDFPDLFDMLVKKSTHILLNLNKFTDPASVLPHNFKYIGGATIKDCRPLSQDLENIVSSSSGGVVLFSLGSLVNSMEMPKKIRTAFLEAFETFPQYTFIWKGNVAANLSVPNVHFRSWLPQSDLLAHPRVKAFITHGGINSIQESLYFGVPMVIIPLFADQKGNAAIAAERGYGIRINKFEVTKEVIISVLQQILAEDSSYGLLVRQVSSVLKDSPNQMREEILNVARLSNSKEPLTHIHPRNAMSFFQFYNFDVYLYLASIVLFLLVSTVALFHFSLPSVKNYRTGCGDQQ